MADDSRAHQQRLEKISDHHVARYGDRSVVPLNKSARIRADLFAGRVGRDKRLLEPGCGAGSLLERYAAATASSRWTSTSGAAVLPGAA